MPGLGTARRGPRRGGPGRAPSRRSPTALDSRSGPAPRPASRSPQGRRRRAPRPPRPAAAAPADGPGRRRRQARMPAPTTARPRTGAASGAPHRSDARGRDPAAALDGRRPRPGPRASRTGGRRPRSACSTRRRRSRRGSMPADAAGLPRARSVGRACSSPATSSPELVLDDLVAGLAAPSAPRRARDRASDRTDARRLDARSRAACRASGFRYYVLRGRWTLGLTAGSPTRPTASVRCVAEGRAAVLDALLAIARGGSRRRPSWTA